MDASDACWVIFHAFLSSADFFKINFSENSFRNTTRVSNSLDPDEALHFVGPSPGSNCLQKISVISRRHC